MDEHDDWTYRSAADLDLPPLDRIRSARREPGLVSTIAHAATTRLLRAYLFLYHRWRVIGSEQLPKAAPFVVIANHGSHLDALVLAAALPWKVRPITFPVAAGDVFFTSYGRSVVSSLFLNALPLWRKKVTTHALADLRQRLAQGDCGLILFPEGARTRDGALMPFKPGLGMLVAESSVPVVPCFIAGAFEALPADRFVPRPLKLTLRVGPAMVFQAVANDRDGWMHVARSAQQAVRSLAALGRETRVG
jgi:1-acyl-sn-glycerol-3-phosphate acyltransferase